jgi:predicted ArsR family transcriptional regulator
MTTKIQDQILAILTGGEKGIKDLQEELNWPHSHHALRKHLCSLIEMGLVTLRHKTCFTNDKRNMSKMAFYQLTEEGRGVLLDNLENYQKLINKVLGENVDA